MTAFWIIAARMLCTAAAFVIVQAGAGSAVQVRIERVVR